MPFPIRFPPEADRIRAEAEAFRRLTPGGRWLAILDLIASGSVLMQQSPHRHVARQLQASQEEEWRQAMKAAFRHYASGSH